MSFPYIFRCYMCTLHLEMGGRLVVVVVVVVVGKVVVWVVVAVGEVVVVVWVAWVAGNPSANGGGWC